MVFTLKYITRDLYD